MSVHSRRLKPPKKNDELLKAIFEDNFPDFLRFMYPDADATFDLGRGLTFMDKELLEIIPYRERKKGKRVADLLVKVYLKDGSEKWILVNTEIEGGHDSDFSHRIFQYFYRLLDRYRVPVETIAVFTGGRSQPCTDEYHFAVFRTSLRFQYLSYQIFDHDESQLLDMDNIFAYIVLACQKALDEDKIPEQELAEQRSTIARRLIETNKYSKDRIMSFLVFLKSFLFIRDKEINSNFDQYIYQVTGGTIQMGVIETIKRQEREKGIQTGKAKGFAEGERKKALETALEFKKMGLPIADIAKGTGLTIDEIEKLK
jgi:predicted transposase/invertase (TIGR01784 family)